MAALDRDTAATEAGGAGYKVEQVRLHGTLQTTGYRPYRATIDGMVQRPNLINSSMRHLPNSAGDKDRLE
jgi:hypothetical protein